jgi:hypothetical protein
LLLKGDFKVTIKARVERFVFRAIIYLETLKDRVYWPSPASKKIDVCQESRADSPDANVTLARTFERHLCTRARNDQVLQGRKEGRKGGGKRDDAR